MRSGIVIAAWLKNSFIDYPGTVSTVLFFSGCNLRCPFCHNPSIVRGETGAEVRDEEVLDFLRRRRGLIGGVVLSGGEPALQPGIADVAEKVRSLGCAVKLDTNGMLPEAVREVRPDYLALDVKTSPDRYAALCAAPYPDVERRLRESADIVRAMGDRAEVRMTLAPGFIDEASVRALGPMLRGVAKVYLQPMQRNVPLLDPAFAALPPVPPELAQRCREVLAGYVGRCEVRGE